jgi:hypothetical protein
VHSEGLGFADNGADSAAPAFPGVDDSLQLPGAFVSARLNCVKLAPLYTVLASHAQVCLDPGFVTAFGEHCVIGHIPYIGGVPDGTAAAAAATQGVGLSSFDLGVVHPLMDKSSVFIPVNDG